MNFILTITTKEICPGYYSSWHHTRTPLGDQAKDSSRPFRNKAVYEKCKHFRLKFQKSLGNEKKQDYVKGRMELTICQILLIRDRNY